MLHSHNTHQHNRPYCYPTMKSPIAATAARARRRSSSFEDLAHLLAAALHLEDEIDHAEGEATSRANENRLQMTNNSEDQDQPSPSTIITNAVPSVAAILASHGKEDLSAKNPHFFPSGSNATKKAQAILHKKQGADAKDQFCGESFRLASFDPLRFVERSGLVILKEESYRSFSSASA